MKVIFVLAVAAWSFQVAYMACNSETSKTEKFILEQWDAQLMDIEEGNLAILKGTNDQIHLYGEWMAEDHKKMKEELQTLAQKKNITVPAQLSEKKATALADLKQLDGIKFDKEFVKMMRIDHLRDIRCLKTATRSTDSDVKGFANKYLPILESHLEGLEQLEKVKS
jgi:putative membrane protein